MHFKRFSLELLLYEEKVNQFLKSERLHTLEMGQYGDRSGYCGRHPSAKYFRTAYKDWHKGVRDHYDQQVKMAPPWATVGGPNGPRGALAGTR